MAKKVFVSQGTVHVRMNKLQDAGIVEKTTLKINYAKLGFDITAFIGIYLEKSALYEKVLEKLKEYGSEISQDILSNILTSLPVIKKFIR